MTTRRMTGGEAVIRTLEACGVATVFGIPGGHNLGIYDALAKGSTIRHVLGRHEQGLAFMADGFARASGRVGVVMVTSGPAVANLGCAMGGATTDTSPVLAIASTVRTDLVGKNRGGLHDCGEAIDIMRPVCRHVRRANTVREIPEALLDLMTKLRFGRPGGAFLEIPCDVLGREEDVEIPGPVASACGDQDRLQPDAVSIERAVALLQSAERPIIWTGTGSVVSDAADEVAALAERIGAAVVTTTLARGILPSDSSRVIMPDGPTATPVTEYMGSADVVLAVGTMFKQEDTADWKVRPGEKLIHVDIDSEELGRSYKPDVGIHADAKAALRAILERMPGAPRANADWIARGKAAEARRLRKRREGMPSGMRALDILRAAVPADGIIACDRCSLGYWASRCLPVSKPRTFFYPLGYGGLGGALPQAFGAKLACPDSVVVSVIGDGGFQFTATELAVGLQEGAAVTIVLCNNEGYGAIRANQDRNFGGRRFACELSNPDFQELAAAYGVPSVRVDTLDGFECALQHGIESNRLNLVELTVDIADP